MEFEILLSSLYEGACHVSRKIKLFTKDYFKEIYYYSWIGKFILFFGLLFIYCFHEEIAVLLEINMLCCQCCVKSFYWCLCKVFQISDLRVNLRVPVGFWV